jgi:hypothetical protein
MGKDDSKTTSQTRNVPAQPDGTRTDTGAGMGTQAFAHSRTRKFGA